MRDLIITKYKKKCSDFIQGFKTVSKDFLGIVGTGKGGIVDQRIIDEPAPGK
jgi:hypothetical protein